MIQVIYQPDRNVPFDCTPKLAKNRPVRHKGRRKSGEVRPAARAKAVLAWGQHSRGRSTCKPVLQQNSRNRRGTLL